MTASVNAVLLLLALGAPLLTVNASRMRRQASLPKAPALAASEPLPDGSSAMSMPANVTGAAGVLSQLAAQDDAQEAAQDQDAVSAENLAAAAAAGNVSYDVAVTAAVDDAVRAAASSVRAAHILLAVGGPLRQKKKQPALLHTHELPQCGQTVRVNSASDKSAPCPAECPFYAQNRQDSQFCTFSCVSADQCVSLNPQAPIADEKLRVCREPAVQACREYDLEAASDWCKACQSGFKLGKDGQCWYKYMTVIYVVAGILVVAALFLVLWIVDLARRPIVNQKGLDQGLLFRTRQKITRHEEDDDGIDGHPVRNHWPIFTNLCTENVAGPGMVLHFNFQAMVIVWGFLVALGWVALAALVDKDLFILGTRKFGTPRENCILVAWGYETQQRLMWTKVLFLVNVYTLSFFLCILHSVRQLRTFQKLDINHNSMKDFAAFVTGLPKLSGAQGFEEQLKNSIDNGVAGGRGGVIGVSICWDFAGQEEDIINGVMNLIDGDMKDSEDHEEEQRDDARSVASFNSGSGTGSEAPAAPEGWFRQRLSRMEHYIFGLDHPDEGLEISRNVRGKRTLSAAIQSIDIRQAHADHAAAAATKEQAEHDERQKDEKMTEMLKDMSSSDCAFVVFETEAARDLAVKTCEELGGFQWRDTNSTLRLEKTHAEPDTVQWINFDCADTSAKFLRLLAGFGCILIALLFWTVVFYSPYAWSIANFNYDNGNEPGPIYGIAFSMVVVIGNAIMYEVCARVSDGVGFRFKDDREACYMILYTVACVFNVLMDFVTTYMMAWAVMQGLGFRTYHGVKLKHVDEFTDQFESYAMQRSLAENTFGYAFPSTFLIPFLLEPIITIYVPLRLGQLIVRSHPQIVGRAAEGWLAGAPMEMGRYADILLDVLLAILIFYFPGGYTHKLFFALAACHCYIYLLDHYRVLRSIPNCNFATMDVDWWSQWMLGPCCALILSCLVFKSNCEGYGYCLEGIPLVSSCTVAFFAHVVVHTLVLIHLVPMFGISEESASRCEDKMAAAFGDERYSEMNAKNPCSYFSANPVHCLRSKYLFKHNPPCGFYVSGKEHLLKLNPEQGCFFRSQAMEAENFNSMGIAKSISHMGTTLSLGGQRIVTSVRTVLSHKSFSDDRGT